MASKSQVPPSHHRRPPGPGIVHPDPYASAVYPPVGGFPHFEMLPPHEVMAHKLSAQHLEIEKLAIENQRLAATHGTLRQDLAASKHELQLIHAHIAEVKVEKEHQVRGITDKVSMMESELEAKESIKKELQQARTEAQSLIAGRQELISKVQKLNRELQMAHSEAQQIPPLMAELDGLRHEYQHCRGTYEYEKKLYNDHLESLQVMEKNHMAMSREVEKLRAQLSNTTSYDHQTGGYYGGSTGYSGNVLVPGNYASSQTYGVLQGHGSHLGMGTGVGPARPAGTENNSPHVATLPAHYGAANAPPFYTAFRGTSYDPHWGHVGAGYDTQKGHGGTVYEGQTLQAGVSYAVQQGPTGPNYDAQRGSGASTHNTPTVPGYEPQRDQRSEIQKGPGYDRQGAPAYDIQRGSGDEVPREANYDAQKGAGYDASSSRGSAGHQGHVSMNNQPYQPTPISRAENAYEQAMHGGVNTVHR